MVTNLNEFHPETRDYMVAAFRDRLGATESALAHASDNFYKNLRQNGERERERERMCWRWKRGGGGLTFVSEMWRW